MKLSTRGEYGLQAMLDLAQNYGSGVSSLKNIAGRQKIPESYLEQLLAVLRKSGLVKTVRGAQGGYLLARDPGQISVGDVIRVLEGPIAPVECVNEEDPKDCEKQDSCMTRSVWVKVRDSISGVLDSITLEDLCQEDKKSDDIH